MFSTLRWTPRTRRIAAAVTVSGAVALVSVAPAPAASARRSHAEAHPSETLGLRPQVRTQRRRIIELPVTFAVSNVNRSKLPCQTDGMPYTIHGHLVAPAGALTGLDRAVTLYLHGATIGEAAFHAPRRTSFDTATQLARGGHASVVIDTLGYGASDDPPGNMVCVGGDADIAHQIVEHLRSGDYGLGSGPGVAFQRVALLGYSAGGWVAEVEAYSFGGIDALALLGTNDQPTGSGNSHILPRVAQLCPQGGETKQGGGVGPRGYIYLWPSPQAQAADVFFDPDPAAARALLPLIVRDPCGLLESIPTALALDHLYTPEIAVPVLLMQGDHDMLMGDPSVGMALQRDVLSGSPEVTTRVIPRAGHHVMAEKSAPIFQAELSSWLSAHQF